MPAISPVIVNMWRSEEGKGILEWELTSSRKMAIFCAGAAFFPTFNVSPAHGFASTSFSFLRSRIDPMLSHPFVDPPVAGPGAAESASEKMAILGFPDLVFAAPPV